MAGLFDLRAATVEVPGDLEIEADDVVGRIALEIDQGVIGGVPAHRDFVAAEVGGLAFPPGELQPDDLRRELHRRLQVGRADPQVADVVEIDHPRYFISGMPKLTPGFTPSRQREVTVLMRE